MKQIAPMIMMVVGIMMLGACKEKKQTEDIITTHYTPKQPQGPIAMTADSQHADITWMSKPYRVNIVRQPMDSVMVTDETGQKYIDNRVKVTIVRGDGSVFTDKTFTKSSFLSYIQEPFRKGGILAGIRFDEVVKQGVKFSVVIAMPDAVDDLFIPLEMTIDSDGGLGIRKNDDMNLRDDYDASDEDGV